LLQYFSYHIYNITWYDIYIYIYISIYIYRYIYKIITSLIISWFKCWWKGRGNHSMVVYKFLDNVLLIEYIGWSRFPTLSPLYYGSEHGSRPIPNLVNLSKWFHPPVFWTSFMGIRIWCIRYLTFKHWWSLISELLRYTCWEDIPYCRVLKWCLPNQIMHFKYVVRIFCCCYKLSLWFINVNYRKSVLCLQWSLILFLYSLFCALTWICCVLMRSPQPLPSRVSPF
jgi:hypothetical protein